MNECMIEINLLQVTNVAKNTNMYLANWKINFAKNMDCFIKVGISNKKL